MKQLIFDIETLGNDSTCICLLASFLVYDLKSDIHVPLADLRSRVKTFKLSISDQSGKYNRTTNPETVVWWKEQLKEAPHLKAILAPSEQDLTVDEFYHELTDWLRESGYDKYYDWAWQRGTLDIMVLDSLWKGLGKTQKEHPIFWGKIRDLRTAIDLCGMPDKLNGYTNDAYEKAPIAIPGFTKHDPVSDILMEVMQLRDIELFPYDEIPF